MCDAAGVIPRFCNSAAEALAVWKRIKLQYGFDPRVNLDPGRNSRDNTLTDICIGNKSNGGLALELSKAFVIKEEEKSVFLDRPAQTGAKLVPAEWQWSSR